MYCVLINLHVHFQKKLQHSMPTVQLYLTLFFPPEILSILSFLFFASEILFYVVIFCIRNPFFQNLYLYLKTLYLNLFYTISVDLCY